MSRVIQQATIQIYSLRCKLGRGPQRVVTMPSYLTFDKLHQLILLLFGFDGSHLHKFSLVVPREGALDPIEVMMGLTTVRKIICGQSCLSYNTFGDNPTELDKNTKIEKYLKQVNDKIDYEYDFGASWNVKITLTKIENQVIEASSYECIDFIQVVSGRGKMVVEHYNDEDDLKKAKKYNKNALNQAIRQNAAKLVKQYQGPWTRKQVKTKVTNSKRSNNNSNVSNISNVSTSSRNSNNTSSAASSKPRNDNNSKQEEKESDPKPSKEKNKRLTGHKRGLGPKNEMDAPPDALPPPAKQRRTRYAYTYSISNMNNGNNTNNSNNSTSSGSSSKSKSGLPPPPPLEKF